MSASLNDAAHKVFVACASCVDDLVLLGIDIDDFVARQRLGDEFSSPLNLYMISTAMFESHSPGSSGIALSRSVR